MRFRIFISCVAVFALISASTPSKAHPHAWIDISVTVLLDDDGRVRGLHETWLFDDFYSAFVMEGAVEIGGGTVSQDALEALLKENMKNLAEYDYFTEIQSGETTLETGKPTNATTRVIKNRLEMAFELPLAEPLDVDAIPMTYRIYDPTFYIEMVHVEHGDKVTFSKSSSSCSASVDQPKPDTEKLLYASSLDQTEKGYDGLGRYFAEIVTVKCD